MNTDEITLPLKHTVCLANGETVERSYDTVVIQFPGRRNVLSTSWMNGGYRKDLEAVFNHQISLEACDVCHAGDGSVQLYLNSVARNLGLVPETATGLITRAEMKNTAIVAESFRELMVTAIVTAGIAKNGGRAGDPASYYENGDSAGPIGGTINTIILISADLPEYAMTRAVMTATEAKAVALQQLMARSIYSTGIATGSGTDMIVIVADPGSSHHLTNTGKHSKLGELIGQAVIRATTAALEMETGLSPASQRNVLVRLCRFGITEDDLWAAVAGMAGPEEKTRFLNHVRSRVKDPVLVSCMAAALHVADEAEWGLIPSDAARSTITGLMVDKYRTGTMPCDTDPVLNTLVKEFSRMMFEESRETASGTGALSGDYSGTDEG
jgi:adenosylcobinamide hydrolase